MLENENESLEQMQRLLALRLALLPIQLNQEK